MSTTSKSKADAPRPGRPKKASKTRPTTSNDASDSSAVKKHKTNRVPPSRQVNCFPHIKGKKPLDILNAIPLKQAWGSLLQRIIHEESEVLKEDLMRKYAKAGAQIPKLKSSDRAHWASQDDFEELVKRDIDALGKKASFGAPIVSANAHRLMSIALEEMSTASLKKTNEIGRSYGRTGISVDDWSAQVISTHGLSNGLDLIDWVASDLEERAKTAPAHKKSTNTAKSTTISAEDDVDDL